MTTPFLIHALPRSGTAWLANFLCSKDSWCYHELLADLPIENFHLRMAGRTELRVGSIETSTYQLQEKPHGFREYVLYRDLSAIEESSRRLFDMQGINLDREWERFSKFTSGFPVIYYDKLFDVEYLREVWSWLVHTPFDEERAQYLIEFNVQRNVNKLLLRLGQPA